MAQTPIPCSSGKPNTLLKISLNSQWVLHPHGHLCLQPLCNCFCFLLCVSAAVYTQMGKSVPLLTMYHMYSSIKINMLINVSVAHCFKLWQRCSNTSNLKLNIRCPQVYIFFIYLKDYPGLFLFFLYFPPPTKLS